MIVNSGHLSCLNVLKRFGHSNPSPLSFPMPGWTLTVDLPIEHGLDKFCDALGYRGRRSRRSGLPCQGLAAQRGDVPQDVPAA